MGGAGLGERLVFAGEAPNQHITVASNTLINLRGANFLTSTNSSYLQYYSSIYKIKQPKIFSKMSMDTNTGYADERMHRTFLVRPGYDEQGFHSEFNSACLRLLVMNSAVAMSESVGAGKFQELFSKSVGVLVPGLVFQMSLSLSSSCSNLNL